MKKPELENLCPLKFSKDFFRGQENCDSVQAQIEDKGKVFNFPIFFLLVIY
jgi:hypothetical protein